MAHEIFEKNLQKTFSIVFEAGYLYKYKDIVWKPNNEEVEEEDEDDEDDDSSSENDSMFKKAQKRKKTSNSESEEEKTNRSGNYEKNRSRQESFKLKAKNHG